MSRKIAYVHYPHGPKSSRLETMPFSFNTVVELAKVGWQVDLYLWEKSADGDNHLLPCNVNIQYLIDSRLTNTDLLSKIWFKLFFSRDKNYDCVFALGQIGAYIGHLIAQSNQCPFVYLNDEFPSHWPNSPWSTLECQSVAQADLIIVPDAQRAYPLYQELGLPNTKPYAVLPNIAVVDNTLHPSIDWHLKLGLPQNAKPFLYAGTVNLEMQVDRLINSVFQWVEPSVLVINGRSKRETRSFLSQYPDLQEHDRIFWNTTPLSISLLNSVVSYSEGNFALYQDTGSNIQQMGFSSGKLMRSLACGCPVIATHLPSLTFVEEYQLGILIHDFSEIPAAIKTLIENREDYRHRCLDFCQVHASFKKHWQIFCHQFKTIAHIDLST